MRNARTVVMLAFLPVAFGVPIPVWAQIPECRLALLGDKDGFGLQLQASDIWPASAGFFDHREPGDPSFTDAMPSPQLSFAHTFPVQGGPIARAQLRLFTLGVQDGDTQVAGSNTDIKLFLDDFEVPGAFDQVDQFDVFPDFGFASIAGLVSIDIPTNLHHVLRDGRVEVRIEVLQLGSVPSIDAFAIDFSELIIGTPFVLFGARLDIDLSDMNLPDDEFDVRTVFALDSASNGIDFLAEDVTVQIANATFTIPAGSFGFEGRFEGVIAGVFLRAEIRGEDDTTFEFRARGRGTNLGAATNRVPVRLTIGDDCGDTTVFAQLEGRPQ